MIADDYWKAGLRGWFLGEGQAPRVIEVPFEMGVSVIDVPGQPTMAGLRLIAADEEGVGKFLPAKASPDTPGERTIDVEFARPPYPRLILMSPQRTGLIAFQAAKQEGTSDLWIAAAFGQVGVGRGYLLPYPAWANVEDGSLRYNNDGAAFVDRYFRTMARMLVKANPGMDEEKAVRVAEAVRNGYSSDPSAMFRECENRVSTVFMDCCAAFALLNCRNVVQEERPPSRADRKRAERQQLPAFSYHVLKVAPLSAVRQRERGERIEPTAHNALHWKRGHFKTFSAERPLFGRITGRFWWQPHLAGRDRARFVDKDYQIIAPEKRAT